jgi:predicted ArsR family transcriptional regulator
MKTTVSVYDFRDAFQKCRPDNFTYEGLGVLFDYLEEYEESSGEELELDVIAICCDFSEDTTEAIAENYSIDLSECEDEDEKTEAVREYLEDEGALIGEVAGGFVYRNF